MNIGGRWPVKISSPARFAAGLDTYPLFRQMMASEGVLPKIRPTLVGEPPKCSKSCSVVAIAIAISESCVKAMVRVLLLC